MKRRCFVLSCLSIAAGCVLTSLGPLLRLGTSFADGLPIPVGSSPVPEKRSDIGEGIQNGRVVLTNGINNRIVLNDIGSIIWNTIDGKKTCNHISRMLSKEFGIDMERASKDVNTFVFSLKKEGVLDIYKIARRYAVKKAVCTRKPA
jgi:hypothetical protein